MSRLRAALRARVTPPRVAVVVLAAAAVVGAGALLEDESSHAPVDRAARLVPAEALAYVDVSTDRGSDQWRRAAKLVRRVPLLSQLRDRITASVAPGAAPRDLERELDPWLGDEVAVAFLQGSRGAAHSLVLLEVADRELAESFLSRASGKRARTTYRGTEIRLVGKLAAAFVRGFLAIGDPANVRAAIDAGAGRAVPLSQERTFREVRAQLPDEDRLLYAYAPLQGVRGLLAPRKDLLGRIARTIEPATRGAAASVRLDEDGVRIHYAGRREAGTGAQPPAPLDLALLDPVPKDAAAFFAVQGLDRLFRFVSDVGGSELPLARTLGRVRRDLKRPGFDPVSAFRPLLARQAGLVVTPAGPEQVLTLLIDEVGEADARTLIDRLRPLFEQPSASGQVPTIEPVDVPGASAATVRLTPAFRVTYSQFGGRLVISTSPKGIAQLREPSGSIKNAGALERTLNGVQKPTSVLFLDLQRLLDLGRQTGFDQASGLGALGSDLSALGAVSAVTSATSTTTRAEIFIEVL